MPCSSGAPQGGCSEAVTQGQAPGFSRCDVRASWRRLPRADLVHVRVLDTRCRRELPTHARRMEGDSHIPRPCRRNRRLAPACGDHVGRHSRGAGSNHGLGAVAAAEASKGDRENLPASADDSRHRPGGRLLADVSMDGQQLQRLDPHPVPGVRDPGAAIRLSGARRGPRRYRREDALGGRAQPWGGLVHGHVARHRSQHFVRSAQCGPAFGGPGARRVHDRQQPPVSQPPGGDRLARSHQRSRLDRCRSRVAAVRLLSAGGTLLRRRATRRAPPKPRAPRADVRPRFLGRHEMTASVEAKPRAGVEVRLEDLSRHYAGVTALDGLSLTMAPGELVALLGPSGCGKTTALRLLAGLEDADGGRVVIAGEDVTNVPANRREIGMVFQAYSLFPHMTAIQNVAFGMQLHKVGAAERRKRAGEMLDLVGLSAHMNKYATQMSGGQQQRVALARALAIEPKVLLLDEPLSALDAKVRSRLRDEIRRVQLEVGITTLFVTHDQEAALAIADRVGVMQSGMLEPLGPPTTIYSRPATPFVAEFVGLTNRLPGVVRNGEVEVRGTRLPLVQPDAADGPAVALVRPEAVTFAGDGEGASGPLAGTVIATAFLGATSRVTVDLGDITILAQLPTSEASAHPAGTRVRLALRPDAVLIARDEAAPDRA